MEEAEINIYPNRWKLLGLLFASFLFIIVCYSLTGKESTGGTPDIPVVIMGIAGLLFSGVAIAALLCMLFKSIFQNKPMLRLSARNLWVYAPAKDRYFPIAWEQIAGFRIIKIYGEKIILIQLYKPEKKIEEKRSLLAKKVTEWTVAQYGTPYSLSTSTLNISTNKLIRLLEEYRKKAHTNPAEQTGCP